MKKNNYVVNLGCRLNSYESSIIHQIINTKDCKKSKIVVNTCSVTNQALRKSLSTVKKIQMENPSSEIIVTGCASDIYTDDFKKIKGIEKIVPNKLKNYPENYSDSKYESFIKYTQEKIFQFPVPQKKLHKKTRALVQIQQGCNHRCTFCIIPFGSGDSISLPIGKILENVNKFLKWGYKEIIFTGIDISSYGNDLPGKPKLGQIFKRLISLQPNLQRIRLSSIDPAEIDDDLIDLLLNEKKFLPHIHLSMQSGDDLILKRMKRRHTRRNLIDLCKKIKKYRPEMTIGSDLIVGFPTEKDENFFNTLECIKECEFSNIHIFPFSPKKGTPASKMPQVEENVKKHRIEVIKKVSDQITIKLMKKNLNKKIKILFENSKLSYTDDYIKVSVTNLDKNLEKKLKGKIIYVKPYDLKHNFLMSEYLNV